MVINMYRDDIRGLLPRDIYIASEMDRYNRTNDRGYGGQAGQLIFFGILWLFLYIDLITRLIFRIARVPSKLSMDF